MLEKNHLKSQFYLDHTFYSSQIHNEFSFKNLKEPKSFTQVPSSKTPQNRSIPPSTFKNILNFIEDPNVYDLNQSLILPSRHPEKNILTKSKRPKICDFTLNSSETQSVKGMKKKKIKFTEKLNSIKTSSRIQTPFFKKRVANGAGEIKDLCDKLVYDQEIMKRVMKKQQENLAKLDCHSPKANLSNFPRIFKFDSVTASKRLNFPDPLNRSSISPNDSYQLTRFNSPAGIFLEPDTSVPKYSTNSKKSSRISPKYYKDKPKIKLVLGFPNKIFTPKNCN